MYLDLYKEQPLHSILLNWLPWTTKKPSTKVDAASIATVGMTSKLQIITSHQITTSLRLMGVMAEDDTMLSSLESLVQAGEISFPDFIGRLQNLFPRAMDMIDVSLRLKITSLMLPSEA